jgi:predicted RNase H-like nuclease
MKLLLDAGIMLPEKPGIDTIDAALCALVALHLWSVTAMQRGAGRWRP